MPYKLGKTINPKDHESRVGTWYGDKYRIDMCGFLWKSEEKYYLGYLGSPNNRFVSEEVVVEISQNEFERAIEKELNWSYFSKKYVTC